MSNHAFAFCLFMAADSGETESSSDEALEDLSDVGLWAIHTSQFRSAYGDSEAKLPKCEILAYLFEDDADLAALQGPFALEPARSHACASALQLLQARALLQARRLQKRCALFLPNDSRWFCSAKNRVLLPVWRLSLRANGCRRSLVQFGAISFGPRGVPGASWQPPRG